MAFAATGQPRGSPFLAVYVAGLVLGEHRPAAPHAATIGFAEGVAWLAQIGLFVMLGLLIEPVPASGGLGPALIIGAVPAAGRPAAVGARRRWGRSGCPGASRPSCPGPGCAGPCRSCSPRSP